jgi:hypothetical protein
MVNTRWNVEVRHWLGDKFPRRWIVRRGPWEWALRLPDLNSLDCPFWGLLKARVYAVKIRDLLHLRGRITEACAAVDPSMRRRIQTNVTTHRLTKCVDCLGEHVEHVRSMRAYVNHTGARLF